MKINGDFEVLSFYSEFIDIVFDFEGFFFEDSSEVDVSEVIVMKRFLVVDKDEKYGWDCFVLFFKVDGDSNLVIRIEGMVVF